MGKTYKQGQEIREFILQNIPKHPDTIVSQTANQFGISRQAVSRYLQEFLEKGYITATGHTRQRVYSLRVLHKDQFSVPLAGLAEDILWIKRIADIFNGFPANVLHIWHYSFTEMVNNAIDHSGGNALTIDVEMNAFLTRIAVYDNGIGIFKKIKEECGLEDERHAVLELAKGKLTTDPESHTGEGIFFTSQMLDDFAILSGGVYFSHAFGQEEEWILERDQPETGTAVFMFLANQSHRTCHEVFKSFASEDEDYGFTKTVVPVHLLKHGVENLVSRSQAKRLLARVDRFKTVILDFQGVDSIGRAFADEIFRVFQRSHPNILLKAVNTVEYVEKMIAMAKSNE